MLRISEASMRALSAATRARYPAILTRYCEDKGLPSHQARQLAEHVMVVGRERGLDQTEDFEGLVDVLCTAGRDGEPDWCREITLSAAPHKGERLRACLAALAHG